MEHLKVLRAELSKLEGARDSALATFKKTGDLDDKLAHDILLKRWAMLHNVFDRALYEFIETGGHFEVRP